MLAGQAASIKEALRVQIGIPNGQSACHRQYWRGQKPGMTAISVGTNRTQDIGYRSDGFRADRQKKDLSGKFHVQSVSQNIELVVPNAGDINEQFVVIQSAAVDVDTGLTKLERECHIEGLCRR